MNKLDSLHYFFIFLVPINIDNIACANFSPIRNAIWPYIDSIPFPYPTNDPINITSSQARPVFTPFPLKFINNLRQVAIIKNTGSNLVITSNQPQLGNITGGILFNDVYSLIRCEFFWDNSLSKSAANYINGRGAHLIVLTSYYNNKYGSYDNAKTKRDGIAQTVFYGNVLETIDNVSFYPLESAFQQVLKAGSSTKLLEFLQYAWLFFSPTFTGYYYAYPGEFLDLSSGKVYYSSTVMLFVRIPRPYISVNQFKATFGSLENKSGKPYSHIAKVFPKGQRPVVVTYGVGIKLTI